MGYIILATYFITILLALLKDIVYRYRIFIYWGLSVILIITAGLRPVGLDPDSVNYEGTFLNYEDPNILEGIEVTFLFISRIVHFFSNDVHWLFIIYAILGVGLKVYAVRRLSSLYFLPIAIYLSYYFVQHECMQIRTGVLSGLMLLMVYYLGNKEKKKAFVLLAFGTLFHYSAILLIPLFFLNNSELKKRHLIIWTSIIPVAYLIHFAGITLFFDNIAELPLVGTKLSNYQTSTIKDTNDFGINVFSPLNLFTTTIYYYLLFFHKTIEYFDRFFPIMIKTMGLGIFIFVAMSFFPVVADRITMLYKTVSILLFADIYYTLKPQWLSVALISCIGIIFLNYCLGNVGLIFLWKV